MDGGECLGSVVFLCNSPLLAVVDSVAAGCLGTLCPLRSRCTVLWCDLCRGRRNDSRFLTSFFGMVCFDLELWLRCDLRALVAMTSVGASAAVAELSLWS